MPGCDHRIMTDTNSNDHLPASHPEEDAATVPAAARDTDAPQKRSRVRGLLIAGGAVLTAAVLAGGGIAVGAAIADEDGDDDAAAVVADDRDDEKSDDQGEDQGDDSQGDLSGVGTDSADELIPMVNLASEAESGGPVSIELKRDGSAEVTLRAEDGAETEVGVTAEGETTVLSTDPADADDTAPETTLDANAIREIVASALAESDGRIIEIEADDDTTSPYDVTLVTTSSDLLELGLDADFAVVSTGTDD